ncbi:putative adenine/guanine permease AZG1-like [Capsicum annuum]|nr:putative adenine/guanine permease AZG1-like [Capsicum annuum]
MRVLVEKILMGIIRRWECPEVFVFIYRGMSQSILYSKDVCDQGPGHRDNVYIVFDPEVVAGSCNYVTLVIPLVGLWALSHLFPPASWFEITSPTLSCVFVLVITLGWYEVFMLKLSAWRTRRNARLRERRRSKAIEMQKLRITATKRCRNCLTPYRDQNPGGGKFMCSYYGHISKRPILDLSVPPGLGLSNSGILRDLVGKGGKILNGKVWSDNRWMCRKIFRITSSRSDASIDAERRAMIDKRCENRGNCQESRGEKAKRKAEEKRLARLEKKLAEEKERKQRGEVARLVEERMKSRNEKMEAKYGIVKKK